MLTIRTSQMQAFARCEEAKFLERVRALAAGALKRPVAAGEVAPLLERGRGYGLVSERDLARYLFIATAAGAAFLPGDPDWIAQIMRAPDDATQRLRKLFKAASQRLADVAPKGTQR